VEDYPQGYPRFSALMASHASFQILRRFSNVRARLLLLAQDRVSHLEARLNEIDREEACPIFLASSRRDKNEERKVVVADLQDALKSYDESLERSFRVSALGNAHSQDVKSLQNWTAGNGCITREETRFLNHQEDLLCISPPKDRLVSWLERSVSAKLLHLSNRGRSQVSRDEHVHIHSRDCMGHLTRTLVAPVLITLVVVPIVVCNAFDDLNARLAIIIAATSIFLTVLALLTGGRVLELAVAGVT
ncbi:hypothetical protein B0T10DRAFT_414859, partial [Thelonectria olida]